jgi:hypothetical protein
MYIIKLALFGSRAKVILQLIGRCNMNLYLISQDENDDYDTFDSAVVAAKNEEDARTINPCEFVTHVTDGKWMGTYSGGACKGKAYEQDSHSWVSYSSIWLISVRYLGTTKLKRGVVLSSFNAG